MNRKLISVLVACATMLSTITMGFATTNSPLNAEENTINGTSSVETVNINENKTDALKFAGKDMVKATKCNEIVIKFNVNVDPDTLITQNFELHESYGNKETIAVSNVRLAKKGDTDTLGFAIPSKSAAKQYAVITLSGTMRDATLYTLKFSNLKSRYGVNQSIVYNDCTTVFVGNANPGNPVTPEDPDTSNSDAILKLADSDKVRAIKCNEIVIKFNVNVDPDTLLPNNFIVQEAYGKKEAIAVSDVRLAKKGDTDTLGNVIPSKSAAKHYAVITLTGAGTTKAATLYTIKFSNLKSRFGVGQSTVYNECTAYFVGSTNQGVPVTLKSDKINATSNTTFTIYFSQNMNKASAENITNYTLKETDGTKAPLAITGIQSSDNKVTFTTASMKPVDYKLTINDVKDVYGNPINTKHSANKVIVHGITTEEAARVITKIESVSTTAPEGSTAVVDSNTQIVVDFDGKVGANATDAALYTIKPRYGNTGVAVNPSRVDRVDGTGNEDKVILTFGRLENITYNLKVENLLNVDGFSVSLEGISFVFAGKGSAKASIEAVLATDRRTLNIYFDSPVDSADIKGDTKIWTDAGINPGALRFKYYSESDTAYQNIPVHKAWKNADNPNVLVIRTNTDAFMSSAGKGSQFVLEGMTSLFATDNYKVVFACNDAKPALPQVTGVMSNDNRTVTIYFDQAVKINGTSNEVFTIGTKELASDPDNIGIPVTNASTVKIADNAYRITTNTDMSNRVYYLRVSDISKITDVSGYYSLKPFDGKNYVSVMFGGPISGSIADVSVVMADNKTIKVYYPERMNINDVTNPANYMIYQTSDGSTAAAGISVPTAVVYDADNSIAALYLNGASISGAAGNIYYLGVKGTISNEKGSNTIKSSKAMSTLGSGLLITFGQNTSSNVKPSIKSVNVNLNDNTKIAVEFYEAVSTASVATILSSGIATADNQIAINDAQWGTTSASAVDLFAITDATTSLPVSIVTIKKVSNTKFEIVTSAPINAEHVYHLAIGNTNTIYNLAGTQVETAPDKIQKFVFTSVN